MIDTATIIAGCAVATVVGGIMTYILRATVSPIKVSLDNNTRVMERVVNQLDEHERRLSDHGERIATIEGAHKL